MQGLVRDVACPIQNHKSTATDFNLDCALACARSGSPLIILTRSGDIYFPISDQMPDPDQRAKLMPFALEAMLNKYGYQITLRAIAVGLVVLTGPLIPLLKGRLPSSGRVLPGKRTGASSISHCSGYTAPQTSCKAWAISSRRYICPRTQLPSA